MILHGYLYQFQDFVDNHPKDQEIAIASHSLGTLVLWYFLFTKDLRENNPAYEFRKLFNSSESKYKLRGLMTMGSPLATQQVYTGWKSYTDCF